MVVLQRDENRKSAVSYLSVPGIIMKGVYTLQFAVCRYRLSLHEECGNARPFYYTRYRAALKVLSIGRLAAFEVV